MRATPRARSRTASGSGQRPAGELDTLVRSKVFPTNGQPLALDRRLRAGDSGPVIIDLIVEGASLLVSQRSSSPR